MLIDEIKAARARAERFSAIAGDPLTTSVLAVMPGLRLSTAIEYHQSNAPNCQNPAALHIDQGLEPYLISDECLALGLHPFICVYDVMVETITIEGEDGNLVGLVLPGGLTLVPADTLIAWR